jgi:hypothetical protein
MERAVCEKCGARQSPGWRSGELCQACGQVVRLERRCAWCLEFGPAGRFCRGCGAELPPPERFGAARMLRDAGVDRLALGERLRGLDPEQAEDLERRHAEQRAVVSGALEAARLAEGCLLTRGHAAALEDELLAALPLPREELERLGAGPRGPFAGPEALPAILEESPLEGCRALAALALLRLGREEPATLRRALGLLSADGPLALEAALAFSHWRFWHAPRSAFGPRAEPRRVRELALPHLDDPRLGPWAAVAAGLASRLAEDERRRLEPALRRGLDSGDFDLAFSAALALLEDDLLGRALSHADERVRETARARLAGAGLRVADVLDSCPDEEEAAGLLGRLPHPAGPRVVAPALSRALSSARLAGAALRWLRAAPFEAWPEASRAEAARFLLAGPPLSAGEVLETLAWASEPDREGPRAPRLTGAARPFVEAATRALAALPPEERPRAVRELGFTRWLWAATGGVERGALDAWLTHPDAPAGKDLMDALSCLDARARDLDAGDLPRGWQLLAGAWERAGPDGRRVLAGHVRAGWSWGYAQDEEATWSFARGRYLAEPGERPALRIAFAGLLGRRGRGAGWADTHAELLPGTPQAGQDPVGFFEELCRLAPGEAYEHAVTCLEGLDPAHGQALAESLFRHLRAQRAGGEQDAYRLMPPAIAFARWLAEACQAGAPREALQAAAEVLRAGWAELRASGSDPKDGTQAYYVKEKDEEVADALARVAGG